MTFGNRLKEAFQGARNAEIARKLKVSDAAAKNYIEGRIPPAKKLVQISKLTGYSIHWLLTGEEPKRINDKSDGALVAVIMGSTSDWETMRHAAEVLKQFEVGHECRVVSAHRTPELLAEYARAAEGRGLEVIIAGAGGAAHLPGMVAAQTTVPVLGVPVESRTLRGVDSLLSIVQMPSGIPVGTLAIGPAGATNAALLAVSILANTRAPLRERLRDFRRQQTEKVLAAKLEEG